MDPGKSELARGQTSKIVMGLSSVQILRASAIIVVIPKINPVAKTTPKGQNNPCIKEGRLPVSNF